MPYVLSTWYCCMTSLTQHVSFWSMHTVLANGEGVENSNSVCGKSDLAHHACLICRQTAISNYIPRRDRLWGLKSHPPTSASTRSRMQWLDG